MRLITMKWADRIYDILVKHCGASERRDSRLSFAYNVEDANLLSEYRFQGSFGFGGKFWWGNGMWYVNTYQESETPEIRAQIKIANEALSKLRAEWLNEREETHV